MIPKHLELVYTEDDLKEAVSKLGNEIGAWATQVNKETGQDVVSVPIMRGGLFFAADLLRQIPGSVEMNIVTARSYSSETNATPRLDVDLEMSSMNVYGRSVLVIDDICDSGRTLAVLAEKLKFLGAKEVKTTVMMHRTIENPLYHPDYVGIEFSGTDWLVGYGLEDRGRWRNLPCICKTIES